MEIVTIVLLALIVLFLIWERRRQERRWREQSDALSRAVSERVESGMGVFGELREKLGELAKSARDIEGVGRSISSLQEALRAPKFRGAFGEVGLETLLKNHFQGSYRVQHRFSNGKVVDAMLQVGDRWVPIDSKFPFPLEDFQRLVSTESEEERRRLRGQFTRTLKRHVDDVSQYIQTDEGTFDFALLYVPAENLYYETFVHSEGAAESEICAYCRDRRVFPVSPSTFYAYLQAIVLGLRGLQVERFARDILGKLDRLNGELRSFQRDYDVLGRHLTNAAAKHTEAGAKLSLLGDRLESLGAEAATPGLPEGGKGAASGLDTD